MSPRRPPRACWSSRRRATRTQPHLALPSLKAWLAQHGLRERHARGTSTCRPTTTCSAASASRLPSIASAHAPPAGRRVIARRWSRRTSTASASTPTRWRRARTSRRRSTQPKPRSATPLRFHDRETYLWAMRTIEAGLKLISTEFWPSLFTAHNYTQGQQHRQRARAVRGRGPPDAEHVPRVLRAGGAAAHRARAGRTCSAISVTYGSQLVPALTLATLVKARWPEIHITLGGGMLAYVGHRLAATAPLFSRGGQPRGLRGRAAAARAVPRGRGERWRGGARGTAAGPDLSGVSNLIWCGADGAPRTNGELSRSRSTSCPAPTSRTCRCTSTSAASWCCPSRRRAAGFYEKCGFCTLYTAIGPTYRERSVERLVSDLQTLQARHGTPYFYFIMDDLPPLMARRIPDALRGGRVYRSSGGATRGSTSATSIASRCRACTPPACRKLMFGFESGSQRVLDLVEKGTRLDEAQRVIRAAHEAGISATLYTMVGLPTETREDADADARLHRAQRGLDRRDQPAGLQPGHGVADVPRPAALRHRARARRPARRRGARRPRALPRARIGLWA